MCGSPPSMRRLGVVPIPKLCVDLDHRNSLLSLDESAAKMPTLSRNRAVLALWPLRGGWPSLATTKVHEGGRTGERRSTRARASHLYRTHVRRHTSLPHLASLKLHVSTGFRRAEPV